MENTMRDRCLICHRVTLSNSSINLEKPSSNTSLLQDFLNCFHINILNGEVNDQSASCQFCLTCEQLIAEWSGIQTQMTQLTRRAAQLESTISALLLSAPKIEQLNHIEDVTDITNNTPQNSQQVELPLLLQQTVNDIRNELRKKYLVNVMVAKIALPCQSIKLNQDEFALLSGHSDNDDEPMDEWRGDDFDAACVMFDKISLPPVLKPDPLPADNVKANLDDAWDHWDCKANLQLPLVPKIEPLSGGNYNDDEPCDTSESEADDSDEEYLPSEDELEDEETSGTKSGSSKTNICPRKSKNQPTVIRDNPKRFKYNGYDIRLNDEDQCYYCGVCNLKGNTNITTTLEHIRMLHYTAEEKIKFATVKTSDTEWLYGGKYKIIKLDDNFVKCGTCGSTRSCLYQMHRHILTQHVVLECPDEAPPKIPKPLLGGNDGECMNHLQSGDDDSDEKRLSRKHKLNDVETSEQIGLKIKTEKMEPISNDSQGCISPRNKHEI